MEDLWAFNEEPVARAIAECPVPVVSAVGHDVDVTIADLVADVRAPTPTAAAGLVSLDRESVEAAVQHRSDRIARGLRGLIDAPRWRLDGAHERIPRAVRLLLERRGRELAGLAGRVDALSPLGALRRGYAVPLGRSGNVLRSVQAFASDEVFHLRVRDGRIRARTLAVEPLADGQAAGGQS